MLRSLGVKSAFDFRGTEERAAALCGVEEIAVHSLPVEPTVVAALRAHRSPIGRRCRSADALEVMRDSYRSYVQHNTPRFRALFAHLLEDRAPLVIHCTAGKDRTGFACALILHALGVPDDVIAEDYLLTNRFYRRDPVRQQRSARRRQAGARLGGGLVPGCGIRGHQRRLWRSRKLFARWPWARRRASAQRSQARYLETLSSRRQRRAGDCRQAAASSLGVEVGDDLLERLDRLLDRRDLHQFPAADRAVAVLQRDDQIPPLLLELNKRSVKWR